MSKKTKNRKGKLNLKKVSGGLSAIGGIHTVADDSVIAEGNSIRSAPVDYISQLSQRGIYLGLPKNTI